MIVLLLRPLLIFDKSEIIKIAQKINSFEISNIKCVDLCESFSEKIVIHSNIDIIKKHEVFFDEKLFNFIILNKIEKIIINNGK